MHIIIPQNPKSKTKDAYFSMMNGEEKQKILRFNKQMFDIFGNYSGQLIFFRLINRYIGQLLQL